MIINDIDEYISESEKQVNLQIKGTIHYAPAIQNMPNNSQILYRLWPLCLNGDGSWGDYAFYHYYGLENVICDNSVDLSTAEFPILKESIYHTVRGKDDFILIELKEKND